MIKEILCVNEIKKILEEFTPYLYTLKSGIVDKTIFAQKIKKFGRVIVLSLNNENVGFAAFYCNDTEKQEAYLSYIAIKEEFSGLGYGKKLICRLSEISKQNGMNSIKLEVRKDNSSAIIFYKKLGFTQVEQNNNSIYFIKKL